LFLGVAVLVLNLTACKKLPRDNPLDEHYDGGDNHERQKLVFERYVVAYENNEDGIINPNETVYLRVFIKNNGTSTANGVKATISTTSSYITGLEPDTAVSYNSGLSGPGSIYPGYEKYGKCGITPDHSDYTVQFKVAQETPAGTEITFNMHITDADGNAWEDDFTVQVSETGAILNYDSHVVAYENNEDGIINPDETVYLRVFIKNNGTSIANGVKATISTTSSYITELQPGTAINYNSGLSGPGSIYPGYKKYGKYGVAPNYSDYTVQFKVAQETPAGTEITFNMHISDSDGNAWEDDFTVQVSATGAILNYESHVVIYDNNEDGNVNPNETVYLKVIIKNNGTSTANGVKATISTASGYITDLQPDTAVGYNSGLSGPGNIYSGYEKYGKYGVAPNYSDYTVQFKVAQETPVGTDITFNMHITDADGNTWEDSFTVQVIATGAILNYESHVVVYENNEDGNINPDETVYLRVIIKNNGTSTANGVKATISTASGYITDLQPDTAVGYHSGLSGPGNIYPGYEKYGKYGVAPNYSDYTLQFKVTQETPVGTKITFDMYITDEDGNAWQDNFIVQVSGE
jgi:hypothetical protein